MLKIKDNFPLEKLIDYGFEDSETSNFDDEYNKKRDMTPIRELKIHKDKIGNYVIHKHQRYYFD